MRIHHPVHRPIHNGGSEVRRDQLGAILEAIDAVYAAAAGGGAWQAALDQIASAAGLPAESLVFFDFHDPALPVAISASLDAEALAGEGRELSGADQTPLTDEEAPLADARRIEAIGAAPVWTARRRRIEKATPGQIFEAMQAMLARAESRFGVLVLLPSRARGGLTTRQVRCLEGVLPHARRALRLNREVLMARAETQVGGPSAAVFLDPRGDVLAVGPRARAIVRAIVGLEIENRRVQVRDPAVARWLGRVSLGRLFDGASEPAQTFPSDAGPRWFRGECGATVRLELARCPRPWSFWAHSSPPPAMAILLRSFEPTAALPPALSEIAELLAEGFSDKEIALRTERPLSTVRTYVTRLYERTGLRSRAAITKWWWTESQLS